MEEAGRAILLLIILKYLVVGEKVLSESCYG